jgi:hypothetical protein
MLKFRRRNCSHPLLRGIYGDEINAVGGYRLQCLCCGRYLYGPVAYVARNAIANEVDNV